MQQLTLNPLLAPTSVVSVAGSGTALVLGTEPAGWQDPAFDDAGWDAVQQQLGALVGEPFAGTQWITDATIQGVQPVGKTWLHRRSVVLPASLVATATLTIITDNVTLGFWVNGALQSGVTQGTYTLAASLFVPGRFNVLAVKCMNDSSGGPTSLNYVLTLTHRVGTVRLTINPGTTERLTIHG